MGQIRITDEIILARQIEDDPALRERIRDLAPGAIIDLEVAGIVGQWMKDNVDRDGRPTLAIKPVGAMRNVWKDLQAKRGTYVTVRQTQLADSYLTALPGIMSEWDSPEDDEAFRDL